VCHEPSRPAKADATTDDLHARIVRLLNDRNKLQQQLRQTETQLKEALERFEKKHVPPARDKEDRRLDDVQKKLKLLLDEVDALRRERKPAAIPEGKPGTGFYSRNCTIRLPVRRDGSTPKGHVLLYVSRDTGKTWDMAEQLLPHRSAFAYEAPGDGMYWFAVVVTEPGTTTSTVGLKPGVEVVIDTKPPVLQLSVGQDGKVRGQVGWTAEDENLDVSSLRLEYRAEGETVWTDLRVPRQRHGSLKLPGNRKPGEVRARVRDLAGNAAELVVKVR
jgi:hypothetical protein